MNIGLTRRALGAALTGGLIAGALLIGPSSASAATKVTMSIGPTTNVTPVVIGKQQGFFKKEGIDLQLLSGTIPPAQVIPSVLSNRVDFAIFSWGALASVSSNGVPITGVANMTVGGSGKKDDTGVFALASSKIKSAKDLRGKTIAASVLNGVGEVTVRNLAAKAGVPQNSMRFVALNFGDMAAALRAGRIDAAYLQEPNQTAINKQAKLRKIGGGTLFPGIPLTAIIASKSTVKSKGKLVKAFQRAVRKSVAYSRKNPKKMAKLYPSFLKLPTSVTNKMVKPQFSDKVDPRAIQRIANALLRFGKIKKSVQAKDIITKY